MKALHWNKSIWMIFLPNTTFNALTQCRSYIIFIHITTQLYSVYNQVMLLPVLGTKLKNQNLSCKPIFAKSYKLEYSNIRIWLLWYVSTVTKALHCGISFKERTDHLNLYKNMLVHLKERGFNRCQMGSF